MPHRMEVTKPASRILLSGASGLVGTAVRQALTAGGAQVVQLVRRTPASNGEIQWDPAATPAIVDPAALDGITAAIHLSGSNVAAHRWTPAYKREMTESRVQSTRGLAMVMSGMRNRPRTLLVASATGIYGNRGDEVLDENSPVGSGFLAALCRDWEAAAQPAVDAGIRVVHLRFGVVLGPASGDHSSALGKMLPIFRLGLGGPLGDGRQWMSWVSLEDAVAAIVFLLDQTELDGAVNVTAPNPVTNREFTHALAKELHRPAIFAAPAFALRLALGEMADEALLSSARAVPTRLKAAGFQFSHPTIEGALAAALAAR